MPSSNYNQGKFVVEGDIICQECGERIRIKAPASVVAEMRHLHFPPPDETVDELRAPTWLQLAAAELAKLRAEVARLTKDPCSVCHASDGSVRSRSAAPPTCESCWARYTEWLGTR